MVIYVSGGSGSGKSAWAEHLLVRSDSISRYYVATMRVWDEEGARRVERHRAMRRDKGFETLECPVELEKLTGCCGAVLLEDLTNLFMNEYFEKGSALALQRVEHALKHLAAQCERLVIVGNDLSAGSDMLDEEMGAFVSELGRLNAFAAGMADECYEVAAGIPRLVKESSAGNGGGLTLIIGGAAQGKRRFAAQRYDRGRGMTEKFEEAAHADVFAGLEQWLRTAKAPLEQLDALLMCNPELTVVCCEVGCGVVPMSAEEREWRELVGRVCCMLAERARRVVRVWCGIPVLLKGESL